MRNLIVAGVAVILLIITLTTALYVVDETEQVVVTRFGEVRDVRTQPGLYLKAPFGVDRVTSYDRRVLRIDAAPSPFLDRDINILQIDVYARYRIVNPRQFLQTLVTEARAGETLGNRSTARCGPKSRNADVKRSSAVTWNWTPRATR